MRDHVDDLIVDRQAVVGCLLPEDSHARFVVGRLYIGHEAPLKAGHQTTLETRKVLRGSVTRQNDLSLRVVERVERVKELLLGPLLSR